MEYELEEVWDGTTWHVVHKMVPKKTDRPTGRSKLCINYTSNCYTVSINNIVPVT